MENNYVRSSKVATSERNFVIMGIDGMNSADIFDEYFDIIKNSEVEKLYENAGVEYEERYNNCTLNKEGDCKLKCSCDICEYSEEKYIYPSFTAEKQLEIVKFMLHKGIYYDTEGDTYWFHLTGDIENVTYRPLDEAIAEFINLIWQDITEVEKEQIRTILES